MNCLILKLKDAASNSLTKINEMKVGVKVSTSIANPYTLGLGTFYATTAKIRVINGTFTDGTTEKGITSSYAYYNISIPSENTYIVIEDYQNLQRFVQGNTDTFIPSPSDLLFFDNRLSNMSIRNVEDDTIVKNILQAYPNLTNLNIIGGTTDFDIKDIQTSQSLTTLWLQMKGVKGNVNYLKSTKLSEVNLIETDIEGDLSQMPNTLKLFQGNNRAYRLNWSSSTARDTSFKRFRIWRVDLGADLDNALINLANCQPEDSIPSSYGGYYLFGEHTTDEDTWKNAIETLKSAGYKVTINDIPL